MKDEQSIGKTANTQNTMSLIDAYIVCHYREDIRIQGLARKFGFHHAYLSTAFRRYKGISPNEYILKKRIDEAKFLLRTQPELTVGEVGRRIGYEDSHYFSRVFKKATSVCPVKYRDQEKCDTEVS